MYVCVPVEFAPLSPYPKERKPAPTHYSTAIFVLLGSSSNARLQRDSAERKSCRDTHKIRKGKPSRIMESGDEANNDSTKGGHRGKNSTNSDQGSSGSSNSATNSNSHGRPHQVVDNTDAAVSAGAGTCLCGHRSSAAGSSSSSELPPLPVISLTVAPTTGGQFELKVSKLETIDNLKKTISKRLKVPKERICLLWKDR